MPTLDIRDKPEEITKIRFGDIDTGLSGHYPDCIIRDGNDIKILCDKSGKYVTVIGDEIEYFMAALKKARELGWWE